MNYSGARPFSDAEIDQVLGACRGRYALRDRLLVELGVFTGFRISELLSVKVEDVYNGCMVLQELKVKRGFMKGRSRSRTMPLHPRVQKSIETWLSVYLPSLPDPLKRPLFPRQRTMFPMTRSQAFNIITRAAAEAGIDVTRISCHSCRKAFARKLWGSAKVGFDIAKMARILGHSNVKNTLTYLEFGQELDAAVLSL